MTLPSPGDLIHLKGGIGFIVRFLDGSVDYPLSVVNDCLFLVLNLTEKRRYFIVTVLTANGPRNIWITNSTVDKGNEVTILQGRSSLHTAWQIVPFANVNYHCE